MNVEAYKVIIDITAKGRNVHIDSQALAEMAYKSEDPVQFLYEQFKAAGA